MLKKGELVGKIISGAGVQTLTIQEVESVKKDVVRLVDIESMTWDARSLREIDPVIPGFSSYLVYLDGGEEKRLRKGLGNVETPYRRSRARSSRNS